MNLKKMSYIVIAFLFFFSFISHTEASSLKGIVTGNEVRFRSATTIFDDSNILDWLYIGDEVEIINDSVGSGNGCDEQWYQVVYEGRTGYLCSEYVAIENPTITVDCSTVTESYQRSLCEQGFDSTYVSKLYALHLQHPNWVFVAVRSKDTWTNIINSQYSLSSGKSLIWKAEPVGYRSYDVGSYDYNTDTFYNHATETNFYYANRKTIEYYMDPRNFLNETNIFMFESLEFSSAIHTKEVIDKIMGRSFMPELYKSYLDKVKEDSNTVITISSITDYNLDSLYAEDGYTVSADYLSAFLKTAVKYNINPIHLSSRIIQEVGLSGSAAATGEEFTYNGKTYSSLYNFYNIGAYGYYPTYVAGLIWANGGEYGTDTSNYRPWNSPYRSIIGGGQRIADQYVATGQNTTYYQKFNISTNSTTPVNTHQYMQNVQAPFSESRNTYTSYSGMSLLNEAFVFHIPIFEGMPESTSLPNPGNPNNYLVASSVKINGEPLEGFANTRFNYEKTVSLAVSNVHIEATPLNGNATVSGIGVIPLNNIENDIQIVVTAQNGDTRTFNIKIIKESDEIVPLDEAISNLGVKYNNEHFILSLGLNVDALKDKAREKYRDKISITVKDVNGNLKNGVSFGSGDSIIISNGVEERTYTAIVYGDNNGDGDITILDLLRAQKFILGQINLNSTFTSSCDTNQDNSVTILDLLRIQKHILGEITISA